MRIAWHDGPEVRRPWGVVYRDDEEIATVHWQNRTGEWITAIDEQRLTAQDHRELAAMLMSAATQRIAHTHTRNTHGNVVHDW